MQNHKAPGSPLWTRDFTIITVGSLVSMVGTSLSSFALSLMILDYTQSTALYAIYLVAFTLPQLLGPLLSGPLLDRFSRKRTIYTLDFLSSGLFACAAALIAFGWFRFGVFIVYAFLLGAINSVYIVAYQSFYPLLITEGNYTRAYSISSVLETVSAVIYPLSALVYNTIGMAPLLACNACTFLIAAIMETRIRTAEPYTAERRTAHAIRMIGSDLKEGFRYVWTEIGLRSITTYFIFSFLVGGTMTVIVLPYFRSTFENGEYLYSLVWGSMLVGRCIGGLLHYKYKLPTQKKFLIAFCVYIISNLIDSTYLFLPVPLMTFLFFLAGITSVTSYNIRLSATQSYVPDDRKGRFNGVFNMMCTTGNLIGEVLGGILVLFMPPRMVLVSVCFLSFLAIYFIIWRNRKAIACIYNREQ